MKAKYINPFTDFGFKKIFGEEASKPLLIDFLNALLPAKDRVTDLSFKNGEQLGRSKYERSAVYDIYCENEKGEKFIVELQKAKQNYFVERTIYYSTFPIQAQAEKGEWNYKLEAVYCIGILDFTFDDYENEAEKNEVIHTIKLKNQNGKTFYDKLTFIYLEMPNLKLAENELKTRLDKWLYFIKHLEDFQTIPAIFKDEVFTQAFGKAEIATLGDAEFDTYQRSLKVFRDNKATYDYAIDIAREEGLFIGKEEGLLIGKEEGLQIGKEEGIKEGKEEGKEEGIKEGIKEGKLATAKSFKALGVAIEIIIQATGLTKEEIEKL
jgi:predicted transposase/invertase (TIGR01784 family)